jgi:hypothetical protein
MENLEYCKTDIKAVRSATSSGVVGWFAPSFIMVSIPSLEATPSYRE